MAAGSSGGNKPPDLNEQTIPNWMNPNGEFGKASYLVLQPEEGHHLPKNPFIIGKTIQQAAGEIERGHTEANRTRYVLKVRKPDQIEKLMAVRSLLDGTPVRVEYHPTLNFTKCVVTCWEAIEMSEKELMECLGPQGVTHVHRMTRKKDGQTQPLPTLIVTVLGTVAPSQLKFGPLVVKTRAYIPDPMMCFNCWGLGHTKKRCTNKAVCGRCGGDHPMEGECNKPVFCVRCQQSDHPSYKRTCKPYEDEKEVQRLHAVMGLSFPEARKMVESGATSFAGAAQKRIVRSKDELELLKELNKKNREIDYLTKKVDQLEKLLLKIQHADSFSELEFDTESEAESKKKTEKPLPPPDNDDQNTIVINRKNKKHHKRHLTIDNKLDQPNKKIPPQPQDKPKPEPQPEPKPKPKTNQGTGTIPKQFNKPDNQQQDIAMEIDQQLNNIKLQPTTSVSR